MKAHLQAYLLAFLLQLINICGRYDEKTTMLFFEHGYFAFSNFKR